MVSVVNELVIIPFGVLNVRRGFIIVVQMLLSGSLNFYAKICRVSLGGDWAKTDQ